MGDKAASAKISANLDSNDHFLKSRLGIDDTFDISFRELIIKEQKLHLYYLNGMCSTTVIQEIIMTLLELNNESAHEEDVIEENELLNDKEAIEEIKNQIAHYSVDETTTYDDAINMLLAGLLTIFIEGINYAIVIDTRQYPGRSPQEPDTERVIRGARDGFTENIVENTTLLRRRIRDERLRNEMMQIGQRSKTDVCVSFIKDIADDNLVEIIKNKLGEIDIDGIPMADKTVEEFIIEQKWNAFPLVRYTERPDIAAKHLLEGRVLIFVDTSPSIIIVPTTYFDHLEHAEEYRQSPMVGTFIRIVRLFAVFMSIFLLPLWMLFVMEPSLLPEKLSYIGPKEQGNIHIIFQIIMADFGVEFLRMAAIHTPTPLATAMGLIAAILIGQIAVDVGLFTPEVILYVAVSTIGSYVTPSYELSVANKLLKILLLILTALFSIPGFMIGVVLSVLYLSSIKTLLTPYLYPLIPFNAKALLDSVLRIPMTYANVRPRIVRPKNKYSQPRDR